MDLDELASAAEAASCITCEVCGEPSQTGWENDWFRTTCEQHKNNRASDDEIADEIAGIVAKMIALKPL